MKRVRGRRRVASSVKRCAAEALETRQLLSGYTVTDLGALPGGNGQSTATGINNNGQVIGYSTVAGGANHPFIYSGGTLLDINPTGGDSQAWGVNDSGEVVGKAGDAFLYGNGPLHSIGRLPGGNTSFAYAINNEGQIAGDSLTSNPSITHAFRFNVNGAIEDLGTLGGSQSNAFGINNLGDVVGLAYAADGVSHAFLYTDGHMVDIGQVWGPAASMARDVNDSGQVVGYGYFLGLQPRHAFLYSNGKIIDLQTLGGISSAAMSINERGQIVGDSNTSSGADHAFVYSNGRMQDLNSLIPDSSGWVLQQASGINNTGQIAGTGVVNGRQHAFLLTPVQAPPMGSISGVVFNDANSDGNQNPGEGGLGAWTVFVDLNGNGAPDPGEPTAQTAADGTYSIAGLSPGTYTVDEVLKSAYTQTAPGGGRASVVVTADANTIVSSFGNVLTPAPPTDTTPPAASIVAPNITTGGGATQTITVVYTDNAAVDVSTIDVGDISVTGPGGPLPVTDAHVSGGNSATVTATYTVAAPGGTWDGADNGSYVVSVKANQVADTSGNFAGGASGSFSVNVPVGQTGNGSDQSFNNGQGVGTNFVTEAVLSQPDGKVLAVGREGDLSAGSSRGVIERLNADGTPDTSFGSNGMIVGTAGVNEAYYAVLMQDAGHVLVAGTSGGDFVLARYNASGKLDSAFANGGRILTDFGTSSDTARGLALTAGGMIVAGGDSSGNLAFARFDASGNLDPNFAQNGRQLYGLGDGTNNGVGAIAVDGEGRVVAAGAEGANVVVVRLTPAGEADGTFGTGGLVTVPGLVARTDLGGPDRSEGLAIQPDGQILIANRTATGKFGIVRLNTTGSLDTTFGINGLVSASFGGDDDADSILLQSSGAIVVIGTSLQADGPDAAVGVFDASGAPMTGFGNSGLMLLPGGANTPSTLAGASAQTIRHSALHVGDIILRAFGTVTPDGRVIVGTSNAAVAATTSSTLRRLIVPGAGLAAGKAAGTLLGSFGVVNGKVKSFSVTDADGTKITFTLTGGTGQVFQSGSVYNITINDLGKGVVVKITGKGGDGRVSLGDVTISGTLRSMTASNSDVSGTLHVTGAIGTANLGNISGGVWSGAGIANLSALDLTGDVFSTGAMGKVKFRKIAGTIASGGGAIASVTGASMDSARILAGANLGADGAVGGSGADADTYGPGAIGSVKIAGAITSSFIGAGVNPVDQTFGNANDTLAGSGASDLIKVISARSADQATRFEAGALGKALLPKLVNATQDPRFRVL
jgi:uncharacterized delta-60 repeat protein